MKEIILGLFSEFGHKIVLFLLVGTTAITTGSAVAKLTTSPIAVEAQVQSDGAVLGTSDSDTDSDDSSDEISPTPSSLISPTPTQTPSLLPTATPKNIQAVVNNSNKCIITLFGKNYDVTTLRQTHSGGDVFVCGTDQTQKYLSKHGTSLSRMARFEVTGSTSISTGSNTTGTSNTQGEDYEDDDEDDEDEEDEISEDGGDDDREDSEHESRYLETEDDD